MKNLGYIFAILLALSAFAYWSKPSVSEASTGDIHVNTVPIKINCKLIDALRNAETGADSSYQCITIGL